MQNKNKKIKILVIDDDVFFRKIYRDQLTKAGFDFLEATNGVEGIHKIQNEHPDLILLDLMLPMKNGFEVLKEVKKNPELEKIPIMILSNLGQEQDVKEGMNLGASGYFVKGETKISEIIKIIKEKIS
ncbi:MAG: response regulator [Patescibacteria group bacterium]